MKIREVCKQMVSIPKETQPINGRIVEVRRWLNAMPFQDNPKQLVVPAAQAFSTWEEWVCQGKEITGVEECLRWILENDKAAVTRSHVVLALGFVGGKCSVNSIINVLKTDVSVVQMEAAAALGRLGKSEVVEPLCQALKSRDPNVRANACIALGRLGGAKATKCLKIALADKDTFVQAAAKAALQGLA
jgi:hypothetical protein